MTKHECTVNSFNAAVHLGRQVRYYPISGQPEHKLSRTRSEAWGLGDHTPVVMIEGISGCVAVANLEVLPQEQLAKRRKK